MVLTSHRSRRRFSHATMGCFAALASMVAVSSSALAADYLVRNQKAYKAALKQVEPGDRIVLANGEWRDFEIVFEANGQKDKPITLMAETPGSVFITGKSNLRMGGSHLVVWGLTFKDGYSPTSEVISFRRDSKTLASNSRLVETVIDSFNKPNREDQDSWIVLHGQNNRVDRNAFLGKTNKGPTLIVRLDSDGSEENDHIIERNYFGPRAPLGGNGGETLRIGVSQTSRVRSGTTVRHNYFDRCDGEVEIISIKSEYNRVTENVFFESRGSVVFRHGGHNEVSRNVFFGNGVLDTGGVRVINDNQVVKDNYLEGLRGRKFLGAVVVMNGVPNSPENRYHQVENAQITGNSFVDVAHMGFGVGTDDERSAVPISSQMSGNILLSDEQDPVGIFDDMSGVRFSGNVTNNAGFASLGAEVVSDFDMQRADNGLVYLSSPMIGEGIGAPTDLAPIEKGATGPRFFEKPSNDVGEERVVNVGPSAEELVEAVANAKPGDILTLAAGEYAMAGTLYADHPVQITGALGLRRNGQPQTTIVTAADGAFFEIAAGGQLMVSNVAIHQRSADPVFSAVGERYMGSYSLALKGVTATAEGSDSNPGALIAAAPETFASFVDLEDLSVDGWAGDLIDLSGNGLDGWYLTDDLMISDSRFADVSGALVRFGREGRDESTFGPRFSMTNSKASEVGQSGTALALDGVDAMILTGNELNDFGDVRIKRRVLGMAFETGGNKLQSVGDVAFINVDDTPLDMTLMGGDQ